MVSRTACSTAPSSPSGPTPQFIPQAIGRAHSGGSGANIRSTDSPDAVSPVADDSERKHERDARQLPHRRRAAFHRPAIRLRLEEDEVGAPFDQSLRLLGNHLFDGRFVLRLDRRRPDRAGHVHRPPGGVGRLAGEPGAGSEDFGQPLGQRKLGQRRPIRPERVGRQHVRPGVAILRMNLPNELRIGKAQLIEAAIRKDVMPIDFGAHRPVEDEHAAGQGFWKRLVGHTRG